MDSSQLRETVRRVYNRRCGYCGVHEEEAGSTLELDHFRPRAAGGAEKLDNLVYCCPTCNRLKGDFWASDASDPQVRRLLHPLLDNLDEHIREEPDGRVTGLTKTGTFHIERLRLNRAPLVALRRERIQTQTLHTAVDELREQQNRLQMRLATLEEDLERVLNQLAQLLSE